MIKKNGFLLLNPRLPLDNIATATTIPLIVVVVVVCQPLDVDAFN